MALPKGAKTSAIIFLVGVAVVVLAGAFPGLRPAFEVNGKITTLGMPAVIEMIMLTVAAIMLLFTGVNVNKVPATKTAQAGATAVIGIMGLAWMGDTFIDLVLKKGWMTKEALDGALSARVHDVAAPCGGGGAEATLIREPEPARGGVRCCHAPP